MAGKVLHEASKQGLISWCVFILGNRKEHTASRSRDEPGRSSAKAATGRSAAARLFSSSEEEDDISGTESVTVLAEKVRAEIAGNGDALNRTKPAKKVTISLNVYLFIYDS